MTVSLVFDLDDTLYLERDYIHSGIRAVDGWARATLGMEGLGMTATGLLRSGRNDRLFDASLAALGHPLDPSVIAKMVSVYREHVPDIRLAPDAEHFLAAGHDYGFALVTDGFSVAQHGKIAALGLSRFAIGPMICTDDWGRDYWKPHWRAFEAVRTAHAGRATGFIYVADNPAKDFLAPRAMGWATIQIDRPEAVHPRTAPSDAHRADMTIQSLDQLSHGSIEALLDQVAERRQAV